MTELCNSEKKEQYWLLLHRNLLKTSRFALSTIYPLFVDRFRHSIRVFPLKFLMVKKVKMARISGGFRILSDFSESLAELLIMLLSLLLLVLLIYSLYFLIYLSILLTIYLSLSNSISYHICSYWYTNSSIYPSQHIRYSIKTFVRNVFIKFFCLILLFLFLFYSLFILPSF